jgi:hypothetical protein
MTSTSRSSSAPWRPRIVGKTKSIEGSERAGSDIDLLVVTDKLSYADVYSALAAAERTLGRPINPTVFTRGEWKKKRTRHGAGSVTPGHPSLQS